MTETPDLDAERQRIDALDRQLVDLLSQRARCAQRIGQAKVLQGGAVFVVVVKNRRAAAYDASPAGERREKLSRVLDKKGVDKHIGEQRGRAALSRWERLPASV